MSKKKSHRGAITARMLANLLTVAGVEHVITIDLHASQMQGFFRCPVDNLVAEPLIARWIRTNLANWREAVVVSKNPGGTKRVTSLADALKISFGIVTTERRRPQPTGLQSMAASTVIDEFSLGSPVGASKPGPGENEEEEDRVRKHHRNISSQHARRLANGVTDPPSSPLAQATRADSPSGSLPRAATIGTTQPMRRKSGDEEYTDEVSQATPVCTATVR
jgi:ribose-phosphate pyrophosphokinase